MTYCRHRRTGLYHVPVCEDRGSRSLSSLCRDCETFPGEKDTLKIELIRVLYSYTAVVTAGDVIHGVAHADVQ